MANYFSANGTIDRTAAPDLLNKAIDVVWMQRNVTNGIMLGKYFDTESKDSGLTHIISSVTSQLPLPQENEDTEALPYFTPAPGFDKTFTLINYRSGIRVTDTMVKADRFSKIMGMISGQINSAARLDEYIRAGILNNAFTGDDGADSKDLCDDDHPNENNETGTWDNKGTGALSGPNLHALRLLARNMTDPQGDPDWAMPTDLLVPNELEQTALELTKSDGKPATALNDPNVLINGLGVTVSPYLSSAVQHYLFCDRTGEEKGLIEVVLSDWNLKDNKPANADIVIDRRIKAIKTFGFTVSKNIMGSTGA
jgi:hypothetical protein